MAATPTQQKATTTLNQELRELISTLSNRCRTFKPRGGGGGSTSTTESDVGSQAGVRIITLAGSNVGATMQGDDADIDQPEQLEDFGGTSVNSNFQAINNSIMLGGNYYSNDPGVHLDITDYVNRDKKQRRGRTTSDEQGN